MLYGIFNIYSINMSTDVDQQPETCTSEILLEESKMLDSNADIQSRRECESEKKKARWIGRMRKRWK